MPNTYTPSPVALVNVTEPIDGEMRSVASVTQMTRPIADAVVKLQVDLTPITIVDLIGILAPADDSVRLTDQGLYRFTAGGSDVQRPPNVYLPGDATPGRWTRMAADYGRGINILTLRNNLETTFAPGSTNYEDALVLTEGSADLVAGDVVYVWASVAYELTVVGTNICAARVIIDGVGTAGVDVHLGPVAFIPLVNGFGSVSLAGFVIVQTAVASLDVRLQVIEGGAHTLVVAGTATPESTSTANAGVGQTTIMANVHRF